MTLINESPHLMDGGKKVKSFPYTFTQEEKANLATQAAHVFQKIERANEEKKAIIKQHDEKIQGLKNEHALLNNKVISGIEQRDFHCRVVMDFAVGKKFYYDTVTNAELGNAPLDSDDYQTKMDFDRKTIQEQAKLIVEDEQPTFDDLVASDKPVEVLEEAGKQLSTSKRVKKPKAQPTPEPEPEPNPEQNSETASDFFEEEVEM